MKIYKSLDEFEPLSNAIVTIGTFDGVHIGHQKILSKLRECAAERDGETILLTFFPHPRLIINPDDDNLRLINDIEEKTHRLSVSGIDHVIINLCTLAFPNHTPKENFRHVLVVWLGPQQIEIGYDHHFGKDRQCSSKDMKELAETYDNTVEQIPDQKIVDVAESST